MKFFVIFVCCLFYFSDSTAQEELLDLCENVNCPVGTICASLTGICEAFMIDDDCPTIRCMLACEDGFEMQDGCPICACKESSAAEEMVDLCESVECPIGSLCVPTTGICQEYSREHFCPDLDCKFACQYGYMVEHGCPVCACSGPRDLSKDDPCLFQTCPDEQQCDQETGECVTCPEIMCTLACKNGFKNVGACPICECREDYYLDV